MLNGDLINVFSSDGNASNTNNNQVHHDNDAGNHQNRNASVQDIERQVNNNDNGVTLRQLLIRGKINHHHKN